MGEKCATFMQNVLLCNFLLCTYFMIKDKYLAMQNCIPYQKAYKLWSMGLMKPSCLSIHVLCWYIQCIHRLNELFNVFFLGILWYRMWCRHVLSVQSIILNLSIFIQELLLTYFTSCWIGEFYGFFNWPDHAWSFC